METQEYSKLSTVKSIWKLAVKKKHKLANLVKGYPMLNLLGSLEREISSIVYDSRKTEENCLFVAVPGHHHDGSRFIKEAIDKGASAIVTSVPLEQALNLNIGYGDVTLIFVEDCRKALAWLSREFYGRPSRDINLVGVTGTNGKTTLTYILENIYQRKGDLSGVIGTVNYRYCGKLFPAPMTTPESLELNRMLDEMAREGAKHCFLEVSSHSLALKRVFGMYFSVGIFTNLSRDHLDFHGDMENYKNAKKSLFREHSVNKRVINIDDPVGREIVTELSASFLTTGIDTPANVMAENLSLSENGSRFTLKTPFGSRDVRCQLLGKHNVYNLLSASAAALLQGVALENVVEGIEMVANIPGRFEQISCGQNFTVLIDYAHTDDALKNAIGAIKTFARNKVITVFGCGGDRDRGKRREMGKVAMDLSDFAVITSDNPRSEDPDSIIKDICEGLAHHGGLKERCAILPNRTEAIEFAMNLASNGDVVLIAGKGHETYQILKNETIHFDDREVARQALKKRLNLV